jgi:hypothetical protein
VLDAFSHAPRDAVLHNNYWLLAGNALSLTVGVFSVIAVTERIVGSHTGAGLLRRGEVKVVAISGHRSRTSGSGPELVRSGGRRPVAMELGVTRPVELLERSATTSQTPSRPL